MTSNMLQFVRCSSFEVEHVTSNLKASNPDKFWGLADTVQEPNADSLWLGCGAHKVLCGGVTVGYFVTRYEAGVLHLGHLIRVPTRTEKLAPAILSHLAASYPGCSVQLDCFGKVLMGYYTQCGFELTLCAVFDPAQAPLGWYPAVHGFPLVYFMALRLPGSPFGEGSY